MTSKHQAQLKPYLIDTVAILALSLAAVIINWKMIRDGLNGHSDMPLYITWLQHFSKQFSEGIWYPRWLAGTNYGYGNPSFVFYPPFLAYLTSFLRLSGFSIEQAVITLFTVSYFLAGVGFYLYGRDRWTKFASLFGAFTYMSSASLCFCIYFRAALSEAWGLAMIPLILWLTDRTLANKKWGAALSIALAILILTHMPVFIVFLIVVYPLYLACVLIGSKSWQPFIKLLPYILLGFGLASLYVLPLVFEKSFVNIERTRRADGGFASNFLSFQFGDAARKKLPPYYFKVNQIFTYVSLAVFALIPTSIFMHRNNPKLVKNLAFWILFPLAFIFLMLPISYVVWATVSTLQMVQFPWRLLSVLSLGCSGLIAILVSGVSKRKVFLSLFSIVIILSITFWNFNYSYKLSRTIPTLHNSGKGEIPNVEYFKTVLYDPFTEKLADFPDFRPLLPDKTPAPLAAKGRSKTTVIQGDAAIQIDRWDSYNRVVNARVTNTATIKFRTYFYPAWHLRVNGKSHPITMADDGTIAVTLEPGVYQLQLQYLHTWAFSLGISLSICSLAALIWLQTKGETVFKAAKLRFS